MAQDLVLIIYSQIDAAPHEFQIQINLEDFSEGIVEEAPCIPASNFRVKIITRNLFDIRPTIEAQIAEKPSSPTRSRDKGSPVQA